MAASTAMEERTKGFHLGGVSSGTKVVYADSGLNRLWIFGKVGEGVPGEVEAGVFYLDAGADVEDAGGDVGEVGGLRGGAGDGEEKHGG